MVKILECKNLKEQIEQLIVEKERLSSITDNLCQKILDLKIEAIKSCKKRRKLLKELKIYFAIDDPEEWLDGI